MSVVVLLGRASLAPTSMTDFGDLKPTMADNRFYVQGGDMLLPGFSAKIADLLDAPETTT